MSIESYTAVATQTREATEKSVERGSAAARTFTDELGSLTALPSDRPARARRRGTSNSCSSTSTCSATCSPAGPSWSAPCPTRSAARWKRPATPSSPAPISSPNWPPEQAKQAEQLVQHQAEVVEEAEKEQARQARKAEREAAKQAREEAREQYRARPRPSSPICSPTARCRRPAPWTS